MFARLHAVEELAYEIKIGEVMSHHVRTIGPDEPMTNMLEMLRTARISGMPVLENNSMVGIISLEDLIRAMIDQDLDSPVRKYMSTSVITVKDYDPVVEALETFATRTIGRLPVVDKNNELVGMITKGDVTRGLLSTLQRDYHTEELHRYRASHLFEDITSDRTSLILRYHIEPRDFSRGGKASSHIKRALLRLGANPQIARRCGIAIYEAEMNLIIHTDHGGQIRVQIEPYNIYMKTTDDGPGIPDVAQARRAGYSTASDAVRELGFGAGMGLYNIERCVDVMQLNSQVGVGTTLEMLIYLQPEDSFRETSYFADEKDA